MGDPGIGHNSSRIIDDELEIDTPEVFLPLLDEDKRYKFARGGRGSGKSHFFGERLIELSAFEPIRAVCIREVQKSLKRSSKQLLEDKITSMGLGPFFRVMDTEIRTRVGGHIIFQGMQDHTAESIKSLEGYDIFWVEEANKLSSKSLSILRPTVRQTPGRRRPELWGSWNPDEPTDPIEVLSQDAENLPGGGVCITANYEDNDYFPDDLRAEMEYDKAHDYEKYLHVWRGGYAERSEKRVFKNLITGVEFETPADANFRFGGDFGFARDPSVLMRCFIGRWEPTGMYYPNGDPIMRAIADDAGRHLFIDYEAYRIGCDVDYHPALFAGDCPYTPDDARYWSNPYGDPGIPGALDWPITADSARPETISYLARRGFRIVGAKKGKDSVKEGVSFLQSYTVVVHARCPHSEDEYRTYSFKVDDTTEPPRILPELEDKKNHVIDANRYALEDFRKPKGFFAM
jgi:phage terminase large subunit